MKTPPPFGAGLKRFSQTINRNPRTGRGFLFMRKKCFERGKSVCSWQPQNAGNRKPLKAAELFPSRVLYYLHPRQHVQTTPDSPQQREIRFATRAGRGGPLQALFGRRVQKRGEHRKELTQRQERNSGVPHFMRKAVPERLAGLARASGGSRPPPSPSAVPACRSSNTATIFPSSCASSASPAPVPQRPAFPGPGYG